MIIQSEILNLIQKSISNGKFVVLTGAGISSESGIPTFRGKGGLWEKYNPAIYANLPGLTSVFLSRPERIVSFITDFYQILLKAKPNPAHLALAQMEKKGILSSVITQNIDNLHQEAGSKKVIQLHGNAYRMRCGRCNKAYNMDRERIEELLEDLGTNKFSRRHLLKALNKYFPRCSCRGRFRPDIVFFGEMLPEDQLRAAYDELNKCSLLFLIGTSGIVYPAAGLPSYAKEKGAKIIEINNEPSAISYLSDQVLLGRAGEFLPAIAADVIKNI